jgi:hypothetical protein
MFPVRYNLNFYVRVYRVIAFPEINYLIICISLFNLWKQSEVIGTESKHLCNLPHDLALRDGLYGGPPPARSLVRDRHQLRF